MDNKILKKILYEGQAKQALLLVLAGIFTFYNKSCLYLLNASGEGHLFLKIIIHSPAKT